MRYRLFLLLVTAFFVTMNVLLWRAEFGGRSHSGTPIPAEVVWDKVLTSPDNSFLEIYHLDSKIGRAHWTANIGEEPTTAELSSLDLPPQGMIKEPTEYGLDFDGNVFVDNLNRIRFSFLMRLNAEKEWKEILLKVVIKPSTFQIHAIAAEEKVEWLVTDGQNRTKRTFTFEELRHPGRILRELGGPVLPAALATLGAQLPPLTSAQADIGLTWDARNDRIKIGSNFIRVYKLQAHLIDSYSAVLFVSRVGEILRVELPGGIVLLNDALTGFQPLPVKR